ncbi:MAG TPA: sigma-70 family RNA polymerase sigma factor [Candidatus Angelobacter sp.]|jgi:RNA polymerase sigma-70 factor (ECF subfamily)|nr:sigma-70 family RNA polymerase sigma factor [Candidatus Angelobacter sp.]
MTSSRGHRIVNIEMARRLLAKAAAPPDWQLTAEQFQITLERSATHRFGAPTAGELPEVKATNAYFESLRLADLALACACSAGNSAAWDHFVAQYRPELYRAARAIAGESGARELADSLYAELFGLREKGGQRKSLFDYFHGRSKLGTWLRAILAQRHVDDFRRTKKTDSLDDTDDGEQQIELAAANTETDPEREKYLVMMQATLAAILDALAPGDRLRLAYYYVEELTLAQIGKLLGEHEATVSRKLERTRREVRQQVETALLKEKKLSEAQLRLCFEYAREQWPFDLTLRLQAGQSRPVSARD